MRIVLAPYGSRGDVEPLVALARALMDRGHTATLAAPPDYRSLAEQDAIPFVPVAQPFSRFFDGTRNELRVLYEVFRTIPAQFEALEPIVSGADILIGSMLQFAAPSLAELHRIPYFYALSSPCYLRSVHQPALSIPIRRPPRWLHHALWGLQDALFPILGGVLLRQRRRCGLPPVSSLYEYLAPSGQVLAAVDESLTPIPPDAQPLHLTGLWRRQATAELPEDLKRFLGAGPPPIFVGFGSVRPRNPMKLVTLIAAAADRAGVRVVFPASLASGSACPSAACFAVAELPHDILFRCVAAVIHHGGAGTFASAALAGRPQAVVAHLGDQYYHGYRVETLGVGPPPLHARAFTASRLSQLLTQLSGRTAFANAARALAIQIRHDGTQRAVQIIERKPWRGLTSA